MKALLDYLREGKISDDYTYRLSKAVEMVKSSEERKVEYMRIYTYEDELRNEGRNEGLRKGRNEGRIQEFINLRIEDGYTHEKIISGLVTRYNMTQKKAEEYLNKRVAATAKASFEN